MSESYMGGLSECAVQSHQRIIKMSPESLSDQHALGPELPQKNLLFGSIIVLQWRRLRGGGGGRLDGEPGVAGRLEA